LFEYNTEQEGNPMKWFHHECSAKYEPRLQTLGSSYGAEGLGIYWGLLEEIGHHSDTFHLKVSGISSDKDRKYDSACATSPEEPESLPAGTFSPQRVPVFPVRILARALFTSSRRLVEVIDASVKIGLFDSHKWLEFCLLHSPSFEDRADDYTRRVRRQSDTLRSLSEQTPEPVQTIYLTAAPNDRTRAEQCSSRTKQNRAEQKRCRRRTEQILPTGDLSTQSGHADVDNYVHTELAPDEFVAYSHLITSRISEWNRSHPGTIDWVPTREEIQKLLRGREAAETSQLCEHASRILQEDVRYPDLVVRAIELMLKASEKTHLSNPFGWVWACLNSVGGGGTPWGGLIESKERRED
jgi:hypothetical protein